MWQGLWSGNPIAIDSCWYLTAYDEIFVSFGGDVSVSAFDQNRPYGAVGRRLSKSGHLEFGYLNQIVQQGNDRIFESDLTLQLVWPSRLRFRRRR